MRTNLPAMERKGGAEGWMQPARWRATSVALAASLGLAVVAVALLAPSPPRPPEPAMGGPDESLAIVGGQPAAPDSLGAPVAPPPADPGQDLVIGRNQTFYEALRATGASHEEVMALVAACKPYRNLRKVRRGDVFRLAQDADGRILSLSFDLDLESYLTFSRRDDGFEVLELTHPVEHRTCAVSGTIRRSLYESLGDAGAPLSLAPKINDILGWTIDFSRDLRAGDSFRILYEEIWKEGQFVRTGPILALECVNRGDAHRAFRFTVGEDGNPGYYDEEGTNLQKQLLRAPLEYSRISSGFSYRRFHPVLKRTMPHLGVDYAAPVGTPVRAAGDGTVLFAGRKTGNGRYVQIRHGNRSYETFYLHLSRFASGIKRGAKVRQGQIIGYVGATGYATGPHLDYRIKRDGRFVDPRRVELPPAAPVPAADLAAFHTVADLYGQTLAALSPEEPPHRVATASAVAASAWEGPVAVLPPPAGRVSGAAAPAR